jgi:hypothetical protein
MTLRPEHATVMNGYLRAILGGDSASAGRLLDDDFVETYPQSGERISGRVNATEASARQPGGVTLIGEAHLSSCGEDRILVEALLDYGGPRYWMVGLYEISRGRLHRSTAYFAAPFAAPDWRTRWVERFDPLDPVAWAGDGDGKAVERAEIERVARLVASDQVAQVRARMHPDYRGSYMQSGETFDYEGLVAIDAEYPGGLPSMRLNRVEGESERWIINPANVPVRVSGGGDTWLTEYLMRYPSGERFHGVGFQIHRDQLVWRQRFYYCAPFEAAAFRADLVERIDPVATLD